MPNGFSFEEFLRDIKKREKELAEIAESLMKEIGGTLKLTIDPYAVFQDRYGDVFETIPAGARMADYERIGAKASLSVYGSGPIFDKITKELKLPLSGDTTYVYQRFQEAIRGF